jgi:hypothetical protein
MKMTSGESPQRVLFMGYLAEYGEGLTKEVQEYCTRHDIGPDDMQKYTRAATMLIKDGSVKCVGRRRHENGKSYMVLKLGRVRG